MPIFLLISQIDQLNFVEKLLWSLAIVATLLTGILLVMSFFGVELEREKKRSHPRWLDARTVLIFFTFFGWTSILAHLWISELSAVLLIGIPSGLLTAFLPYTLSALRKKNQMALYQSFEFNEALRSTGQVLSHIPSGRGGTGKVHLNLRSAPYQIEAISNGRDLPVGAPVRVVEVIEGRILVVEPLEGNLGDGTPPHAPV